MWTKEKLPYDSSLLPESNILERQKFFPLQGLAVKTQKYNLLIHYSESDH